MWAIRRTGNWWRTCGYKSFHPNGANFATADGAVRFVSRTIDFHLYCNAGTRDGGDQATLE